MEGFSYNNIFDTKGIEYIAILIFFAFLIPFWFFLNRKISIRQAVTDALGALIFNRIQIPRGVFFNRNHTWAFLERSGEARIGIDDFLLRVTGDFNIEPLVIPGQHVRKGAPVARIRQEGRDLTVSSPITGQLLACNGAVLGDPSLMHSDPYVKGWIFSIHPDKWVEETSSFYIAEKSAQWIASELTRFRDFIAQRMDLSSVVLQDGGEIAENALSCVPDDVWKDFEKEFLSEIHNN